MSRMSEITTPETNQHVTIFATTWCPYCQNLLSSLSKAEVPFAGWDVEKHDDLAEWVKSVNGGNRVVPTVLYSDGTYETNPPAAVVEQKYLELAGK